LKKLSQEDEEREFQEELAVFESAKVARDPAPVVAYLRRYPSGYLARPLRLA